MKAEAPTSADGDGHTAPPVMDEFIPEPVLIPFPPPPTQDDHNSPRPAFSPGIFMAPPNNPVVHHDLSAGTSHNLVVSRDGNAYSWGPGNQCELGLGPDVEVQPEPVPLWVKNKALDGWRVGGCWRGSALCAPCN